MCKSTTILYHLRAGISHFTRNTCLYSISRDIFTGSTTLEAKLLRNKQRNIQTIPALIDRQQTAASHQTENLTELPDVQIPDDQSRGLDQDLTDLLNIFESGMCLAFIPLYLISVLHMIRNIMLLNH